MIPLFKVFMSPEAGKNVTEVLNSGYVGQGPKVDEFEAILKNHFKNDYILTVNSGTSALQLAIHLIKPENGFEENDEIICTPLTCFATVSSIIANNCNVKWADVDPKTCNIDLIDVERKLTKNTKAVMVVHWGGTPVDLDELERIKNRYKENFGKELIIIEDCAHCWNSKFKNKLIGNSGNYCCFSLQAIKFLNTCDGGILITPDDISYKRAKKLRWFGLCRDSGQSFRCVQNISESGFKYHMNDVAAMIGIENYKYMDENVKKHQNNSLYLKTQLSETKEIILLNDEGSSNWLFTMLVERRDDFIKTMEEAGISCSPVHARCDKHSCVDKYKSFLPGMDYLESRHVSIPCGWWLKREELEYIVNTIKKGWEFANSTP